MRVGETITVMDVHENKIVRQVVAVEEGYVYVSRPEEIENSRNEGREPNCIGFPLSDVVCSKSQK